MDLNRRIVAYGQNWVALCYSDPTRKEKDDGDMAVKEAHKRA
ncbi:MAG TPA: hypothetical protein VGF08_09230 [Terriglobales bacterium]